MTRTLDLDLASYEPIKVTVLGKTFMLTEKEEATVDQLLKHSKLVEGLHKIQREYQNALASEDKKLLESKEKAWKDANENFEFEVIALFMPGLTREDFLQLRESQKNKLLETIFPQKEEDGPKNQETPSQD